MKITDKLTALRTLMKERGMYAYLIPTSDFHETEYVGEHFKARAYMSGFTGSQGTLLVCEDKAALWTDGRYFIQAENQLKGSTIELMRMGEEGVPSIDEYLKNTLHVMDCLGFDGRTMNTALVERISKKLEGKEIRFSCEEDLVGMIWEDRPALPKEKGFFLEEKYTGKSTKEKLEDIRKVMKEHKASCHIVTTLDDIAWILNMRGNDVKNYPVMLSYLIIEEEKAHLFVDETKLDDAIYKNLKENNIEIHAYNAIYSFVKTLDASCVMLDKNYVNYAITSALKESIEIVSMPNPSQMMKAMKNEVEQKMTLHAHIKDAVAVTKFMYWLKTNIGKTEISEISATEYLLNLRKQQDGFIEPSFNTITAYKDHGAMMHYSATEETNYVLQPEGLLLVDSGGQYLDGTTDITRTFVLGEISDEIRFHFTTTLRSNIALSKAKFLYGCRGMNLDILARGPLWDLNLDYKCGTGHGIGHVLNVHEGPNGFRWKIVPERNDSCVLEEGMIQSNEPGVYIEGSHGIRHENEMIVRKGEKNEYGQFMYLEPITFVPFDLDGVDTAYMTKYEIAWLNEYHAKVYDIVSPYLNNEEKEWLKHATRAI